MGNGFIRIVLQLILHQFTHDATQFHHATDTLFGFVVQLYQTHDRVFSEIHLAINHRVGEVFHIWTGRNGDLLFFLALHIFCQLHRSISSLNVSNSFPEQLGQFHAIMRANRQILLTILGAFRSQLAQNHCRVLHKVAVHGEPVRGSVQVYPVRHNVDVVVTLLEEDDVGHNLCTGICLKRIVGQTNSSQQLGPLSDILSGIHVLGIHSVSACHKSDQTTGTNLIERLGEKIVMNREAQLVIGLICHLVVAKRHIAHRQVEEVTAICGFKASHRNISFGIELLGNASGDGIQLHTVQLTVSHFRGQHTKEVTHAHGRLQNVSGFKTHTTNGIVDGTNHRGTGEVGIEGGRSGRFILTLRQQVFQVGVLLCPCRLVGVKGIRQTAPAHIVCQNFLLLRGGIAFFLLQRKEGADCCDIAGILYLGTTHTQIVIGDDIVLECSRFKLVVLHFLRNGCHYNLIFLRPPGLVFFLQMFLRFGVYFWSLFIIICYYLLRKYRVVLVRLLTNISHTGFQHFGFSGPNCKCNLT